MGYYIYIAFIFNFIVDSLVIETLFCLFPFTTQAGYVGIGMSVIVLCFLCLLIVFQTRLFGRIFTNDDELLSLFEECAVPFTVTLFFMNLSVAIEKIPYSMGRTKEVFWMGLIASWCGQVSAVIIMTK